MERLKRLNPNIEPARLPGLARCAWKLSVLLLPLISLAAAPAFSFSDFGRKAVGTSSAQFLKLGVNARAIAMGEAYSAVADGADALYWNPAGLARVNGKAVSLMHALYLKETFYDYAAYAHNVKKLGTFGASVQYLGSSAIDQTNDVGADVGTFKPYDLAVTVGWARLFHEYEGDGEFMFGASAKFIQSKIIETATTGSADVGLAWNPYKRMWLAIAVQNMGGNLKFKNEGDDLPLNIKTGVSYPVTRSLLLALDANFPRDNDPNAALGAEYKKQIADQFWMSGRTGFNSRTVSDLNGLNAVSAGAGLSWKSYGVDFAWVPFGVLGHTYRISFSAKY